MSAPFILGCIALPILVVMVFAAIFNKHLPIWFCHHMSWHLQPHAIGFDGCSATGVCPRCGKPVLQDSQGNWF